MCVFKTSNQEDTMTLTATGTGQGKQRPTEQKTTTPKKGKIEGTGIA